MSRSAARRAPAAPALRKFRVRFEGEVEIEVSDELLKTCNTDDWRATMVHFTRDEQFVEHIAANMVLNGAKLEVIDGYADQPKERVKLGYCGLQAWDVEATEIKP